MSIDVAKSAPVMRPISKCHLIGVLTTAARVPNSKIAAM